MSRPNMAGANPHVHSPSEERIGNPNDIIIATLPDGSIRIVKGETMLKRLVASGRAETSHIQFVPVESEAEADALLRRHGMH